MESLIDIQEDINAKMLKSKSNFKKCPKERLTVCYIETRIENLEQQWQLFYKTHVKLISEVKKSDLFNSNYHKNGLYDEVEEFYIQFKSELKEILNNVKMSSETCNVSQGSSCSTEFRNFKLPEVKIPVFSGNYKSIENKPHVQRSSQSFHVVEKGKAELSCPFCSAAHKVTACKGFAKEHNDTRRDFAQKNGLCFICLGSNHSARFCRNTVRCHLCKRRHHTLLHPSGGSGSVGEGTGVVHKETVPAATRNITSMEETQKTAVQAEGSTKPIVSCLSTGNCKETVLIPTALVKARSKDGTYRLVRALVDQGSQGSFITESMAQYLGLKKILTKHRVTGVGGNKTVMSNSSVVVDIRSRVNPDYNVQVNAYVLKSITSLLPVVTATRVEWVKLNEDVLADPEYHRPNKIDVLLGAEIFSQILQNGIQRSTSGSLVAQETELGWILSGVVGELCNTAIWFNGPEFLRQSVIEYKKPKHLITKLEEVKVHSGVLDISFWERFSSLSRMIRVVAYCRRFLHLRIKCANKERNKQLSTKELEEAMEVCIRKGQEEELREEIQQLKKTGSLGKKGRKYKSLNLFLDSKGIIRVGGRLEMSQLSYDCKHPILVPKDSFLAKLLLSEAHLKTMHGGPQAMIAYLRSRYWVVGIKTLVRAYFRKCVTCIRYTNKARSQLMGQLPSARVTPNKVFLYSGVDYAGPINIRVSKGRGNKSYKGYVALFVCLSTRAIHIEAVSDMTSKGFLAAFKRFVARRGHCAELHSDNGTNFVGAARELQELFNEEKSKLIPELVECLANNGTKWNFIPPHAPNFGGLWEAGIKSTKYHLRRVIGNSTLTFEELTTVLAQIEACLNSRPLSCVDQNELTVLTPGHFLIGEPLVLVPDSNYEKANISSLRRWQLTQRMVQDYWRRWSQDYLNQFLQRHKWAHQNPEPAIGCIVLVKEDDLPPGKWLLGKIELKHPGPDGITRVVTVKTKNSLIKRPITKLAILPVAS
ncbi:unnamed protein product [Parnassius mnemosyne]|uniref:Endonuclease n=1 Tax=Parnassius mnemosyne TaxID=213953 RepID=A0AAV1LRT5_9NEOP